MIKLDVAKVALLLQHVKVARRLNEARGGAQVAVLYGLLQRGALFLWRCARRGLVAQADALR